MSANVPSIDTSDASAPVTAPNPPLTDGSAPASESAPPQETVPVNGNDPGVGAPVNPSPISTAPPDPVSVPPAANPPEVVLPPLAPAPIAAQPVLPVPDSPGARFMRNMANWRQMLQLALAERRQKKLDRTNKVLEFARTKPFISAKEVMLQLKCGHNDAGKYLSILVKQGKLKRTGGFHYSNTRYEIIQ